MNNFQLHCALARLNGHFLRTRAACYLLAFKNMAPAVKISIFLLNHEPKTVSEGIPSEKYAMQLVNYQGVVTSDESHHQKEVPTVHCLIWLPAAGLK